MLKNGFEWYRGHLGGNLGEQELSEGVGAGLGWDFGGLKVEPEGFWGGFEEIWGKFGGAGPHQLLPVREFLVPVGSIPVKFLKKSLRFL